MIRRRGEKRIRKTGIDRLPYEWLEEIINAAAERIVVVDREGIIRYMIEGTASF
jgi:hypothetical protein